ncbi:ATP-dependent DNA helicase II subunit 1 [Umbelopsis nana]
MSSSYTQDREGEEDDILNPDEPLDYSNHDSILFVIDASPAMLQPQDEGDIPLQSAFRCVQSVLLSKAFSSPSDSIGVLVYGTRAKQNDAGHEHIYILQNMESPDAPRIKEIESYAQNITAFVEEYGSVSEEFPLGNVFWTASNIFSLSSKKKGSRRIFLLTNEDNPHATNISLRNAAIRRAKDLWEVGIRIELFSMDRPGHAFNNDSFYTAIVESEEAIQSSEANSRFQQPVEKPRSSKKLGELLQKIRRKEINKRSEFRIPFHINDELTIGIVGYALVREQTRSNFQKVLVTGEQVKEVESVVTWKCVDTNQLLLPTDIKYYYNIGNEPIVFTRDELAQIRSYGEPDYIASRLPNHSKSCYPMQEEVLDSEQVQVRPPGFHVIIMPYADDMRALPVSELQEADDEQIDAAKAFVERLSIKGRFDPLAYENPFLQRHYAGLQAAALEHPIEDVVDKTLPRNEAIHKRIGKQIHAFNDTIKRSCTPEQSEPNASVNDDDDRENVMSMWQKGELKKCTVPILKQFLLTRGISPKQVKADLMMQVSQYFQLQSQE